MKRPNKYNAKKTVVDGITFDSKAEAKRYGELLLLQKAEKIEGLRVHTPWPLFAAHQTTSETTLVGRYESDFDYFDNDDGGLIVEDVKGMMTPFSAWKIKHFEAQYGIDVKIVRGGRR